MKTWQKRGNGGEFEKSRSRFPEGKRLEMWVGNFESRRKEERSGWKKRNLLAVLAEEGYMARNRLGSGRFDLGKGYPLASGAPCDSSKDEAISEGGRNKQGRCFIGDAYQ